MCACVSDGLRDYGRGGDVGDCPETAPFLAGT